jgi:type II secretory pathway component GspD/PulD (secretin)
LKLRILACALAALCCAGADRVAATLARDAHKAQDSGQLVRAYLLYAEAAARDPQNPTYRANRDALASVAKLLTKADIQNADISSDVKAAESAPESAEPPVELASRSEWTRGEDLQPLPRLLFSSGLASFDTRADERSLFEQVTKAYGIRVLFDPQLDSQPNLRFAISNVDFRTAMEALTAVTHTFVFPISQHDIFVARDTQAKRGELEPHILLTFPLPETVEQRDLVEAANAVRGVMNLRVVGWDSVNRQVMIRDRVSRARIGRALMESLLLPRAQVSLEVEILTLDSDRSYHYGASLQTTFQLINLGHIGGFQSVLPTLANAANLLAFGGGSTLFGFGLTDATFFATYSRSFARNLFDATVVVADGQTASLHIGDKFPIPQTLYSGFQQSASSIYNPIGQVTLEDLGIILKVTPHINGDGEIGMELETDYKALGSQSIDTVPEISERQFKGNVTIREGQWAVFAGLDESVRSSNRNGLAGISQIPGLNQFLSENTKDLRTSNTLLVIKPTITRLPMSPTVSPQFVLGPQLGERVVL